ncbi:MAG TPA: hypothetical protein DCS63_04170 [Elusimicrobia bacterium]|nr:hypothetical protein [Elusimicrobiota bacterium]
MNIPNKCPSCSSHLIVTDLCCAGCKTTIKGKFDLPNFAALNQEEGNFLRVFLAARGNIKEVERRLDISYPTVKGKLESLLNRLGLGNLQAEMKRRRQEIVERLERGEITAQEAVVLIRKIKE